MHATSAKEEILEKLGTISKFLYKFRTNRFHREDYPIPKNNPQKLIYLFLFITRILSRDVIILFRLNEICTRCVTVFK